MASKGDFDDEDDDESKQERFMRREYARALLRARRELDTLENFDEAPLGAVANARVKQMASEAALENANARASIAKAKAANRPVAAEIMETKMRARIAQHGAAQARVAAVRQDLRVSTDVSPLVRNHVCLFVCLLRENNNDGWVGSRGCTYERRNAQMNAFIASQANAQMSGSKE